jgi:transcriptional regulator with XRE-family HTH domain
MDEYNEDEFTPAGDDNPFAELPRLGQLLRHYRHRSGLSQRLLARESGVDESNISLVESGKTTNPWDDTLYRLACTLALHIPNTSAERITERLIEAKRHKPTAYTVEPGLVLINDRLGVLGHKMTRIAIEAFNHMLDALENARSDNKS